LLKTRPPLGTKKKKEKKTQNPCFSFISKTKMGVFKTSFFF